MSLFDAVVIRLKQIMKEKHINANYFTAKGGIPRSTVSQVLNHKQNRIMLDLLYQLLTTLEMTLKDFFNDPIFEKVTD